MDADEAAGFARVEWLSGEGPSSDVVVSSRVRLARNIAGFPFLTRASREEKLQLLDLSHRHIEASGLAPEVQWQDLNALSRVERQVLVERHLISKQHAKGSEPRGVAIGLPRERLSIMVNEEDHLRIQVLRSGLALRDAYEQIDRIDDRLEERLDFAMSDRFGYLTACPTNVGTGIRVSVMLHLPGLKLTGEIDKVRRAAKAMSLAVRGFYGEGSESIGDFFQISNQTTLGRSEEDLLHEFETRVISKVIEYERSARRELATKRTRTFEDRFHRSLGLLRYARLLKAEECLEQLSYLRLGVSCGLDAEVSQEVLQRLVLLSQPAHLQRVCGRELSQAERRVERARLVRAALAARD
ncbi:MAG: protein arginine kinase [Planctomycetota bacterium]